MSQLTWPQHAIWWQLHPVSFLSAPPANVAPPTVEHRLARLEPWLDYLVRLWCNPEQIDLRGASRLLGSSDGGAEWVEEHGWSILEGHAHADS